MSGSVLRSIQSEPCSDYYKFSERLLYDPETGLFIWRISLSNKYPGKLAGTVCKKGYLVIKIWGSMWEAQRIAWLLQTGQWPIGIIDHRDRNKLNNKFSNLRDVNHSINGLNSKSVERPNYKITYIKQSNNWRVLDVNNKPMGYYKTVEEARMVRDEYYKTNVSRSA